MSPEHRVLMITLINGLLWALAFAFGSYGILRWATSLELERREFTVRMPLLFKLFLPFVPQLRSLIDSPRMARQVQRAADRLTQAGIEQTLSPSEFVALRLMWGVVVGLTGFAFLILSSMWGVTLFFLFGLTLIVLAIIYPSWWLSSLIRRRHRSIQRALPNVLDLLTLSVEAGRDFLTALRDILQHRPRDPLGQELERVFREVQLGKQRRQALRAMAERTKQPDLSSVVETLVQADELGVSIGHILRILGDQMRQKRFATAEKLANESPVKMLFPLFIFIMPAVLIVMLGPVMLRYLKGFL